MSWGDCEICKGCTDDTCYGGCGMRFCGGRYMGYGCDTTAAGLRKMLSNGYNNGDPYRPYRRLQSRMRVHYAGRRPRTVGMAYPDMAGEIFWQTLHRPGYWTVRFDDGKVRDIYEGDLR